ncbi:MAG: TldD/PmbA family protein [Planctomycetota bacterium]
MLTRDEAKGLIERILVFSRAAETEVIIDSARHALTRFAEGGITQNVEKTDASITIRTQEEGRVGRFVTNRFDEEALASAVETARVSASFQKPDPDLLPLPEPSEYTEAAGYDEAIAELSPEAKADAIRAVSEPCSERGLKATGTYSNDAGAVAVGNSRGVFAFSRLTQARLSVTALSEDSSGWCEAVGQDLSAIDPERVGQGAIEKCLASRSPEPLEPGPYTVVLEPSAVAELLMFLTWCTFGAQPYLEGRSFLSGRLGEKVFGEKVTILDDAFRPGAMGLPFDFEGVPRRRVELVENGVAKQVVWDRHTARREPGRQSTGHALPQPSAWGPIPLNLVMAPGDSSLEEMIASTERGILVSQFHYTNVTEPVNVELTGMTRNGTFLLENGKVSRPLLNLRFTQVLLEALNRVVAVSRDTVLCGAFFGGFFVAPAIKIDGFHFTSVTER